MIEIRPNLWFDGAAEEAARFYASIFPDSHVDAILRAPGDNPATKKGQVVLVEFTLGGRRFVGINGGPQFRFTEAVSFQIECEDQAELDRYWTALTADGGSPGHCGWCKDRYGLSWQVTPRCLGELVGSSDPVVAERSLQAMLGMSKIDIAAMRRAAAGEMS